MKLHPAFDMETQTWFVEVGEQTYEAKSLRELEAMIPGRVTFIGWAPDGYKGKLRVPGMNGSSRSPLPSVSKMLQPQRTLHPLSKPPKPPVLPIENGAPIRKSPTITIHNRWTPEMDSRLVEFWSEGYSAERIGVTLHVTRNAVIGRVHRLRKAGVRMDGRINQHYA